MTTTGRRQAEHGPVLDVSTVCGWLAAMIVAAVVYLMVNVPALDPLVVELERLRQPQTGRQALRRQPDEPTLDDIAALPAVSAAVDGPAPAFDRAPIETRSAGRAYRGTDADARTMLAALNELLADGTYLSPAQVTEINHYFSELARLGPAAVGAIGEQLRTLQDIAFSRLNARGVAYPSLRAGLIAILGGIGGPAATAVLLEALERVADPYEIAALAGALEQVAPGVFRQRLLSAAREALERAARQVAAAPPAGDEPVQDVSPLFDVMQALGDSELLRELIDEVKRTSPPWAIYSMIALAELPDGSGVPVLSELLVSDQGALVPENLFALHMLAQSTLNNPSAGANLLEVAAVYGQEIPEKEWNKLAWTLRGHKYEMGATLGANPGSGGHDSRSNVNIRSLNLHLTRTASDPSTWTQTQIEQRLELIDQLLALDPPGDAASALGRAKDWILHRSLQG